LCNISIGYSVAAIPSQSSQLNLKNIQCLIFFVLNFCLTRHTREHRRSVWW
jgi:hypothetical protein